MKFILSLLFVAAIAFNCQAENTLDEVDRKHYEVEEIIETVNSKLKNTDPHKILSKVNTHSAFRLSEHLKKTFESIRTNTLKQQCALNKCKGSESYQHGVMYACLRSHPFVSKQVERFEQFVTCNDNLLKNIVATAEIIITNEERIKSMKENLDNEYKDDKNRDELLDVYDYYLTLIQDSRDIIDENIGELENLVKNEGMQVCLKNKRPEISKAMYDYTEVKGCIKELLTKEKELS